MHGDNIIHIVELVKRYGGLTAVDGISLDVKKGEMFGLVGPDGAGKTSTIRVLCGLTNFDSGEISLLKQSLRDSKNKIQKQIGYLSQKFSLYGDLTVDENIEFFADIHNVKNYKERRDELLEFTRLKNFRTRFADNLSGGMKQKLALACSLIHKPQIIFLDEPTTGVDPVSRRDFWKILSGLLKEGITIFMSTPYLDEAERCNRVAMMNKGKIIAMEKPDIIKTSIGKIIIEIVCSPVREAFKTLKENNGYDIQLFGDRINVVVDSYEKEYPEIKKILIENSIEIKDSRTITPTLENVFMYLIKTAS
ncbi:MAG: ABC transporter ATP-binding protein [Melioribacteraceae bacterium]|nr:ABC transporter ATP-binding protein [Melioribacteraceae bacterium]MCF8356715.1 ABC transporter ATP-binding protein [Melioribacteraceae bacterium]MCF8396099.1 ABC transporter ATP-binding protein [Melioribacteraceae bacterium]MCF8421085.1 ABC transporter ATP-binding protein [Melioribacteraceae bacterium]